MQKSQFVGKLIFYLDLLLVDIYKVFIFYLDLIHYFAFLIDCVSIKFVILWDMKRILSFSAAMIMVAFQTVRGSEALDLFVGSGAVDVNASAVVIIDLASGKMVENHNEDSPLLPASVMKSVTIASLLQKSGIDYRYHTLAYALGDIYDGTLHGDLLIVGSGDPSLNSSKAPITDDFTRQLVDALKESKVSRIAGTITVDESIFPGPATHPTWAAADLKHSYGTGCHGLNFENNSHGSASVANPAAVMIARLMEKLAVEGIIVEENKKLKRGNPIQILDHESAPVDEIMRSCMMRSDNLYAEAMLRTLAVLSDKDGSTDEGAVLSASIWRERGLPMNGVVITDGSGLSRSNRLTARFLAEVLCSMSDNVDYVSFFPLAGEEGTLKNFLKDTPLAGYIAMKTGSMNGVQCYAGYKLDEDYVPTHVVVVLMNNFKSRAVAKDACGKMLLSVFNKN